MKNIVIQHIRELLYYHECVIIPDFGGFICSNVPSVIDHKKNFFYPPSRVVYFNRHLVKNDGLLIHSMATAGNKDYAEVKAIVEQFVREIYDVLNKEGQVVLKDLGVFKYSQNKNLYFEPDRSFNLNLQSFGMYSFSFPALYDMQEEALKTLRKKLKNKDSVSQIIRHKYTKRAIVALPIALILTLIPFKTNIIENTNDQNAGVGFHVTNYFEKTLDNPHSVDNAIDKLVQKENALLYVEESFIDTNGLILETDTFLNEKENLQDKTENNRIVDKKETVKSEPKEKEIKLLDKKYQLIAASFAEESRAKAFCTEMKQKGFNAVILPRTSGRFRISVNGFENKSDALVELNHLRDVNGLSVWLLTQ